MDKNIKTMKKNLLSYITNIISKNSNCILPAGLLEKHPNKLLILFKQTSILIAIASIQLFIFATPTKAIYDPLSTPNNKFGVHILDPSEIDKVPALVNSNNGQWGYVTIPIRSDDRDRVKWNTFFEKTKQYKLIPIIRLATFGNKDGWVIPTNEQMLAFIRFLNQFSWPTQNRYLIMFNEPNHSQEWGGYINPEAYAKILYDNIKIIKNINPDFFVLPAAMDMAAPQSDLSLTGLNYWKRVFTAQPKLIDMIDGWNAHAYPNPAFSAKPTNYNSHSLQSYKFELQMLSKLGRKKLPIFITETGWDQTQLTKEQLTSYWKTAFQQIWDDPQIVAITPFLLQAHDGPFTKFSLLDQNNTPTVGYTTIQSLTKIAGQPKLSSPNTPPQIKLTTAISSNNNSSSHTPITTIREFIQKIIDFFNRIFNHQETTPSLTINQTKINLEIAQTPEELMLGLGNRPSLPKNKGMLFIMPQKAIHTFWMKNTLFPLDIIWIDQNKIVDITPQIAVEKDPSNPKYIYSPSSPVKYVLEVNAGFTQKNNIHINDQVKLKLK